MKTDHRAIASLLHEHEFSEATVVGGETEGLLDCECGWMITLWIVKGDCTCFDLGNPRPPESTSACKHCQEVERAGGQSRDLAADLTAGHLARELGALPEVDETDAYAVLASGLTAMGTAVPDAFAIAAGLDEARRALSAEARVGFRARLDEIVDHEQRLALQHEPPAVPALPADPIDDLDLAALDAAVASRLQEWAGTIPDGNDPLGRVTFSRPSNSSINALTVKSGRKGIGRLLLDSGVLLVNDETHREEVSEAAREAGLTVRAPIAAKTQPVFLGEAKAIGAWGNVIGLDVGINSFVALADLDTEELFLVSPALEPSVTARLHRMGVQSTATPRRPNYKRLDECGSRHELLNSRLAWFYSYQPIDYAEIDPRYAPPKNAPLRVGAHVANELPAALVAAFEEQLRGETFDPTPIRQGRGTQYWEHTNGVLDDAELDAYRALAPDGCALPAEWSDWWDIAEQRSLPHAPTLCALLLQLMEEEWWYSLPLQPLREGGTWLVGHSPAQPAWLRQDHTRNEERRLQAAVALIVKAMPDLAGLRQQSRRKITCSLCSRSFERGMLQAGDVFVRETSEICDRCASVEWPTTEADLTTIQREGIQAAIRCISAEIGRSASLDDYLDREDTFYEHPETTFLMDRPLPRFVLNRWDHWVQQSEAGAHSQSPRPRRNPADIDEV